MLELVERLADYSSNWSTVAGLIVLFLIAYYITNRKTAADKKREAEEAKAEYEKSLETDPPEKIILKKKKYLRLKKYLSIVVLSLLLASCKTKEVVKPLPVGDFVITPVAGDIVPKVPEGEVRWLLVSVPTGAKLILDIEN